MTKSVFITGANGFIGTKLRRKFAKEGWNVLGVDIKGDNTSVRRGNTTETAPWEDMLDEVDLVIHTAAIVSNDTDDDLMWEVNVQGTKNVAEAAARHGVKRFVHLSSIVVYGYSASGEIDETRAVHASPEGGSYVLTKVASEQAVFQTAANNPGTEFVVVRPGDAYGPGIGTFSSGAANQIKRGTLVLGEMGRGYFRPIYTEDLVNGVFQAAIVDGIGGEVFNLTPDGYVTTKEFFGAYYKAAHNLGPWVFPTKVAVFLSKIGNLLNKKPFEGATPSIYQLSTYAWFSNEKARTMLGWEPKMPLKRGLEKTCEWLLENHLM